MRKEYPLLSIIIPTYNDATLLEGLLKSIQKQTFQNFEILIIDGNSDDNIKSIVSSYSKSISYFVSETDKGIFDAMNKGVRQAKGQWLYFIGADDRLFDARTLERIFSPENQADTDIIYAKVWNNFKKKAEGEAIVNQKDFIQKNLWHQSMFFKSKVFKKVGLYEIKYKIAADTVFNLKAFCLHHFNWKYLDLIVSSFSGEGISAQRNDTVFHKNQYALYFNCFNQLTKKEIYMALQHHLYVEIKQGKLADAIAEYLKLGFKTGKWKTLTKNSLHFLKLRLYQKRKASKILLTSLG